VNKRRLFFWMVFLGSAGVIAAIPEFMTENAGSVSPVSRPAALATLRAAAAPANAPVAPAAPAAPAIASEDAPAAPDLFAAKSWYVPPPPPPAPPPSPPPPPPPAPSAPPLPFKFIGKFDDATSLQAFLQRDEKVYTVGVGDVIENTYRVASINAGQMTLIYLPLNLPQTLAVGSLL
jgi:hypothetical protein